MLAWVAGTGVVVGPAGVRRAGLGFMFQDMTLPCIAREILHAITTATFTPHATSVTRAGMDVLLRMI